MIATQLSGRIDILCKPRFGSLLIALFCLVSLNVRAGTTEAYSWYTDSLECWHNTGTYNSNAEELATRLLGSASSEAGCITNPWLAGDYWQYGYRTTNHAGIDFRVRVSPASIASAAWDGKIVSKALDPYAAQPRSTLVIESSVAGVNYRIFYLHCSAHTSKIVGATVAKGEYVCTTGAVGSPAGAHLHLEVKRQGTPDYENMRAVTGAHCYSGSCYENDIENLTVDPVDLITEEKAAASVSSGTTSPYASQADAWIAQCTSRFSAYIGQASGAPYTIGPFRYQRTTGGWFGSVIALAVEEVAYPQVFWYYWGGWQRLPISFC